MCDYSDDKMLELFLSESYPDVECSKDNGYYIGKRWMTVTLSMWKEDIANGLLFKSELYSDNYFPHWWLDKVLK
jgi:hypothetical protein